MKLDTIEITVLPDGRMKLEVVGTVKPANHGNAEAILRAITSEIGGPVELKKRHGHQHQHQGHHVHSHVEESEA